MASARKLAAACTGAGRLSPAFGNGFRVQVGGRPGRRACGTCSCKKRGPQPLFVVLESHEEDAASITTLLGRPREEHAGCQQKQLPRTRSDAVVRGSAVSLPEVLEAACERSAHASAHENGHCLQRRHGGGEAR